jgi:hypothetical protein
MGKFEQKPMKSPDSRTSGKYNVKQIERDESICFYRDGRITAIFFSMPRKR